MSKTDNRSATVIKTARVLQKQWSQLDLAAHAGVSLGTVRNAEKGLASKRTTAALARALEIPVGDITGRTRLTVEIAIVKLVESPIAIAIPVALSRQMGPWKAAHHVAQAISDAYGDNSIPADGKLTVAFDGTNYSVTPDEIPLRSGERVPCFLALPAESAEIVSPLCSLTEVHDFRTDRHVRAGGEQ